MGIGSASVSASQTKSKEEVKSLEQTIAEQQRLQTQRGSRTGSTTQQQEQEQTQTQFGAETLNLLENLAASFAPQKNATGILNTGAQTGEAAVGLQNRAGDAAQEISGLIDPIMQNARSKGERELQTLQTQLAQQAGGSLGNTFVTSATAQGRADLESQLAAMESELQINARATQTQEMMQSFSALLQNTQAGQAGQANDLQAFLGTVGALKGGRSTATGTSAATGTSEEQTMQNLIDLLNSMSTTEIDSTTRTESTTISAEAGI